MMGIRQELRVSYDMVVLAVEVKRGKLCWARVGLEVLVQMFTWKKGGVEDTE